MGIGDKIHNAVEEVEGAVKKTAGHLMHDEKLEDEGKTEQAKGSVKQAGEKVKDAFKE